MGDNNNNNISSSPQNTRQQRNTNFYYPHSTNISIASSSTILEDEQQSLFKDQEKLLPIANVGRIMKQILPPNAKISKESKETMQECVSEFISFVTGEASDKCNKEKRKTVNGDDICWALENLGFDNYAEPVKRYLVKYRDAEGERANQNKAAPMMVGETEAADGCPTPSRFDLMENRRV